MGKTFHIIARNNLGIPIRLFFNTHGTSITIAISESRVERNEYDETRIAKNLEPNMETWETVGKMDIEAQHYLLKITPKESS